MEQGIATNRWWRAFGYAVGMGLILSPGLSWGLEVGTDSASGTTGNHLPRRRGTASTEA